MKMVEHARNFSPSGEGCRLNHTVLVHTVMQMRICPYIDSDESLLLV